MQKQCSVVVLISGNGSNLQALIDASLTANFKIVAVVSNNPTAFGLERAKQAEIPALVIDHCGFPDRVSFDTALISAIDEYRVDLVVLAGFMRILSPLFVQHYAGRVLNIHPSLLPNYPGVNTHQRVLQAGDKVHGATVHFVTEDLDGGPVIAHAKVDVSAEDSAQTLAEKVHTKEHSLYPQVVAWFASHRLHMENGQALLDDNVLPATGLTVE